MSWYLESKRHSLASKGIKTGRKKKIPYPLTSNDISYGDKLYGAKARLLERKTIETKVFPSDVEGGSYSEETDILKVELPDGTVRKYKDVIFRAPWQVGGNSGHVRDLEEIE